MNHLISNIKNITKYEIGTIAVSIPIFFTRFFIGTISPNYEDGFNITLYFQRLEPLIIIVITLYILF